METLLIYLPGPVTWSGTLERTCQAQGVTTRIVPAAQMGESIAALLGLPAQPCPSSPAPKEPVLLLSGFSRARMETFLDALAAAGIPPVLKAMVTPTNLAWSFSALAAELSAERRSMGG